MSKASVQNVGFEVGKRYKVKSNSRFRYGKILKADKNIMRVALQPKKKGEIVPKAIYDMTGKLLGAQTDDDYTLLKEEYILKNQQSESVKTRNIGPHTCVPVDTGFPTMSRKWCKFCDKYL